MPKTRSEQLFESFCELRGIRCRRVAEGTVPTPDYDIFVPRRKIVVEVKEFTINKDEQHAKQERLKTGFSSGSVTPGDRVRKKISDAGPQIRRRTKNRFPGLLVLFDRGSGFNHLDPYSIRVAMYGLDTVQFAVPRDHRRNPYVVGAKSGPKRKMTPEDNTSISAIGALYCPERGVTELVVYHNGHASIPLRPELLRRYGIRQYRLGRAGNNNKISQWEKIRAG